MLKRAILLICVAFLLTCLSACGEDNSDESGVKRPQIEHKEEEPLLTNSKAVEKLGLDWFFIPKKSTNVSKREATETRVDVSFKGCGYVEVNQYAASMETAIQKCGYPLYVTILENQTAVGITEAPPVTAVIEDEQYSGTAYSFIYKTDKDVFVNVTITYYGSAGGKYGSGLCKVMAKDCTSLYMPYYEESKK